jgi:hypothetical protein
MNSTFAGLRPGLHNTALLGFLLLAWCLARSAQLHAADFAEAGARAMLTVKVSLEGEVNAPQGNRDEVVRWSTRRLFESTVEVEARKPDKASVDTNAAGGQDPQADLYADLAKQAQACGQDQACMMRMAMQMTNSPELKAAKASGPRYQVWEAVNDATAQVTASYEEKSYSMFYVSGPEISDCTLLAPKITANMTRGDAAAQARLEKKNESTLQNSARSFAVEVDQQTQSSKLVVGVVSAGRGEEACTLSLAGNAETTYQAGDGVILPEGDLKIPLMFSGGTAAPSSIASGSAEREVPLLLTHLGSAFGVKVTVPLKLKVSWELKQK